MDQQHPCAQSISVVFVIQEGKLRTADEETFLNLYISEHSPLIFLVSLQCSGVRDLVHLGTKMLLLYFPSGPSKPRGQLGHTAQGALQGIDKAAEYLCLYFSLYQRSVFGCISLKRDVS